MKRGVKQSRIVLQSDTLQDYFTDNADEGIHDLHKQSAYLYNDKIYIAYGDVPEQLVYIMAYDTNRAKWSDRINIGTLSFVDSHRLPSILVDSTGIIHVFFDAHTGSIQYIKSTYPEDISQWETMPLITDHCTYPQAFELPNGDIMLFYRGEAGVGGGHDADWVYRVSSDSGATWSAETHILDGWISPGPVENGWYVTFNQRLNDKEDIYCGFQYFDGSVPGRYNAYYMFYDVSTSLWKNSAGNNITGLLPLTKAQADANCLVRNSGANDTTCARGKKIFLNAPGECHCVVYSEKVGLGNWEYKYADWKLGAWNIYNIGVSGADLMDNCCLAEEEAGANLYLYAEEGVDVEKWSSVNLGVNWNKDRDVVVSYGMNPQMVRNNVLDDYVILGHKQAYIYQHSIDDFIKNYMPIYSHNFEGFEQRDLIQITPDRILDTDQVLVMDNGSTKTIIKGWDLYFSLLIHYLETCHNPNLETFIYQLIDWLKKVKLTPHEDKWFYTYHIRLTNSRYLYRSIHELKEDSNIEMRLEKLEPSVD